MIGATAVMPTAKKDLSYYQALRYPYELTLCAEGGYFARHPDLEGCATQADTVQEAMASLEEARELWLETKVAENANIPEPPNEEPSGRLMLRVPLYLHSVLERCANELGLSLNRLLNEVLFNHAHRLPLEYGLKSPSSNRDQPHGFQENRSLEYYLAHRYPYYLTPSEEGGFVAEHPDLPGCVAQGDSAEEAVAELDMARELWFVSRHEEGLPIPEALALDQTGIISLRMPPALHYHLARHATRNGVSLNQWLVMALAEFAGGDAANKRYGYFKPRILQGTGPRERNDPPMKNRTDFLTGLRLLGSREFVNAFESFSRAYRGGLNFSTTGVELYRSMPEPMSHRQLHDLLFELSQIVPGNTSDRREVHLLLVTWLEGIKEEAERQEEWLAIGREERALAYA
jgi:antitoxin HicB